METSTTTEDTTTTTTTPDPATEQKVSTEDATKSVVQDSMQDKLAPITDWIEEQKREREEARAEAAKAEAAKRAAEAETSEEDMTVAEYVQAQNKKQQEQIITYQREVSRANNEVKKELQACIAEGIVDQAEADKIQEDFDTLLGNTADPLALIGAIQQGSHKTWLSDQLNPIIKDKLKKAKSGTSSEGVRTPAGKTTGSAASPKLSKFEEAFGLDDEDRAFFAERKIQ